MEMQPSLGWGMVTVKEPAPVDGMKDAGVDISRA